MQIPLAHPGCAPVLASFVPRAPVILLVCANIPWHGPKGLLRLWPGMKTRPLLSCLLPPRQNEVRCKTLDMENEFYPPRPQSLLGANSRSRVSKINGDLIVLNWQRALRLANLGSRDCLFDKVFSKPPF